MQPIQSYPVFEADQVLSNSHLNNLLNYLEQQERLTRIKLLGRGIVCGLEINSSKNGITISKGCGLTSQGYLIQLCETNYTFFKAYTPPALPNDLYFLTQCSDEQRDKIPYYNQKDILELIPENDKETDGKKSLSGLDLKDYAVVLFLEAEQIDLKNCDTQDCNDKGSRMDFDLRILLVNKKLFDTSNKIVFNSILLKRFNVPVADLKTTEDILQGFLTITDDNTLNRLSQNLVRSWDKYAGLLGLPEENPIKNLDLILIKKKLSGNTTQKIYVQYFYDFVDDLFKAYLEFRSKAREVFGECCPDEMDFPLHLSLGMANENTILGLRNDQRQYFEPSPIQNGQTKNAEEAAQLLQRLVEMVNSFIGDKLSSNDSIIITPTNLGSEPISYRCIPYYYDWKSLNDKWYFKRSYNGNERYNLGYRASQQVDAPEPVKNPLLYDLERNNAFRIEGHVGKNYKTALTNIISQRNKFNLPFDVLALNAMDLSAILNGKEIQCHVEDLASDYRVMITGIVCQLQQIIAYVGNLRPKRTVEPNLTAGTAAIKKDFYISRNLVDMQKAIKLDLSNNQPLSITNEDIIKNLALRDVEEGEKLADFVAKDVGLFIVDHKAFFDYIIKQPDLLLIFLQQLAEIVKYLLAFDLDKFDEEAYNKLWTPYSKTVASLITAAQNSENEEIKEYFTSRNTELLFKCANEKLFALKDEYLKRVEQYDAAVNFSIYFQKHPGLEHKAGVTKGGTFILVYNGVTEKVITSPNFNLDFVNFNTLATFNRLENPFLLTDAVKSSTEKVSSTSDNLFNIKSAGRTEFEFASDLIKKLNLGDAAKNVLDALNLRDKEIREQEIPIAKGTVIADFYLPYMCCSDCPPIAFVIPEVDEPVNIGPVAEAGEDQTLTLAPNQPITLTLDGSDSKDEDGTITSYSWSQISGPEITLKTPKKVKATAEFKTAGEYIFELTVTDDKGATNKDSVKISVIEPENKGPVADAGKDQSFQIATGQPIPITLDGTGSKDEDGSITAFSWVQISGPQVTLKDPEKAKATTEIKVAGEYVFELKVTDDRGASNKDSVRILITEPDNVGPVADAGKDQSVTLVPGRALSVTLDGSNSKDPDGTIASFTWTKVSGPQTSLKTPNQAKTAASISEAGTYIFELEVKDDKGASNKDSVTVTARMPQNNPPVANAGADVSITIPNPNTPGTVNLDGSNSSDPENGPLTFSWGFSSGPSTPKIQKPAEAKTTATGLLEGQYIFKLEVKDSAGLSSTDTVNVNVVSAPTDTDTRTKTCDPIAGILEAFTVFDRTEQSSAFKKFLETFGSYGEVKEFFTSMKTIASSNLTKQISFFESAFGSTGLVPKLREWLEKLNQIILEFKDFRAFAFQLYQIISQLIVYVVCIQKEDYDQAKIPMVKVFDSIESHASAWAQFRNNGSFARTDLASMAKIKTEFSDASAQTRTNGEAQAKAKYLSRIKKIEGIL